MTRKFLSLISLLWISAGWPACDNSEEPSPPPEGFTHISCLDVDGPCHHILAGDADGLQERTNLVVDGETLVLAEGTWDLDNQVTVRGASGIRIVGQGMDLTTLSFANQAVQGNGVDVVGDDFTLEGLTVADSTKDGVRIEDSVGVTLRGVRVTWTNGPATDNGAYGLYPVTSEDVLVEDCEATNAADAGLYVGQVIRAVVRNNVARGNVAGIEIENTQYADVYGNLAEDNTVGLAVFDLPGNPIAGRDVWIHDNVVRDNNRENFAPGGTVEQVPAGTGTFALASRRVLIENNTYENNGTGDIAILSGLAIEADPAQWVIDPAEMRGDYEDLALIGDESGMLYNYRSENIVVKGNTHSGSGENPDMGSLGKRPLGFLIGAMFAGEAPVDSVLYDTIGESAVDPADPTGNSNDNHICVGGNTNGTFVSLHLEYLMAGFDNAEYPSFTDMYRPESPFAPFDCTDLAGDSIVGPGLEAAAE